MNISFHDALVVIDVQNDFCPGGALPVPEGERVVPALNRYIERFVASGSRIFATRDWHPPNHLSFKERGGIWPRHCVKGTPGASLHAGLGLPPGCEIVSKGSDPDQEAYSAFQGTGLAKRLRDTGVRRLFVGGLATDFCVKETVLDARKEGMEVFFLEDASRGVGVSPGDVSDAIVRMREAGARTISFSDLGAGADPNVD